jgi:hypothetical protein
MKKEKINKNLLPTFEQILKKQLYDAGDTQDFKTNGNIIINELWLRNFHKIAQNKELL